jgi:formylglycine-generating enzyme required for sulfatase activity
MTTRDAYRLLRGGSWIRNHGDCRSAYRDPTGPDDTYSITGFRVVCLPREVAP